MKSKKNLPILFCDVDATICDIHDRNKVAGPAPDRTDVKAYGEWLDRLQQPEMMAADRPIPLMQYLVQRLASHFRVVYLTARHEKYYEVTWTWLAKNGFPASLLIMRREGDRRPMWQFKEQAIKDCLKEMGGSRKALALDDDMECTMSAVYEMLQVTHLKAMFNIQSPIPTVPEVEDEKERMLREFKEAK